MADGLSVRQMWKFQGWTAGLLGVGVNEVGGGRGEEGLCVDQALRTQAVTGTDIEHAHGACTCVSMVKHAVLQVPSVLSYRSFRHAVNPAAWSI